MPEGRVRNVSGTLKNEYIITDQQGNSRVSFEDDGSGNAKIVQENSYYAFGMIMPNSSVATPSQPNKNLYNGGSEMQDDLGGLPDLMQTFYRNYDAALGRWTGIDPIADAFVSITSYNYAGNDPLMFNDPMGDQTSADGIPQKHDPAAYMERWFALWQSEEYRRYRDDIAGDNGPEAQQAAFFARSADFNMTGPTDYAFIAKVNTGLQPYAMTLSTSKLDISPLVDGVTVSFNTRGDSFEFNTNGWKQIGWDIVPHSFFVYTGQVFSNENKQLPPQLYSTNIGVGAMFSGGIAISDWGRNVSIGFFGAPHTIGQSFISIGKPTGLEAGGSFQVLAGVSKQRIWDISGSGLGAGAGYGDIAGSYSTTLNSDYHIVGLGPAISIQPSYKLSGSLSPTTTYTVPTLFPMLFNPIKFKF